MKNRKVEVYEYQQVKKEDGIHYEKVSVGYGAFIEYGMDCQQEEYGIGSFSTAIVEMPDGSIKNVPVEHIVFNN